MAKLYVDPVNGSDSNNGLTSGAAKQTIAGLLAIPPVANDEAVLMNGTHVLSSSASVNYNFFWSAYPGHTPIVTGNYAFQISGGVSQRWKGITFKNASGTNGNSGPINSGSTSNRFVMEDCTVDLSSYTNATWLFMAPGSFAAYNCLFTDAAIGIQNLVGGLFQNCIFKNLKQTAIPSSDGFLFTPNSNNLEFVGCKFIRAAAILRRSSNTLSDFSSFKYCTFNLKNGRGSGSDGYFFFHSNANGTNLYGIRILNCIFQNTSKIIHNNAAGVLTLDNPMIRNNWINSATDISNYTSVSGDITTESSPLFYDESNDDYRLEPTSTAAVGNNGLTETMGAEELQHPTTFFTSIPESKVENAYAFKQNSRTNNKTGSAVSGAGVYPSTSVVKTGSGTYGPTGTEYTPAYTPDFPAPSNVLPSDTTDGVPGIADVDALANLPSTLVVKTGSPNYGKNQDKVPAYSPDFADPANVLPNDTTNGVPGIADVDALANLPSTTVVKSGSPNFGKNLDKVASYTPDFPERENVAPDDTVDGESGLMDLPSLDNVSENDSLRGNPGTLHLPYTDNLDPTWLESGRSVIIKDVQVDGVNKGENFNSVITPEILAKDEVIQNLGNEVIGSLISSGPDSSPANEVVGKLIKGESIILDGVQIEGQYDLDLGTDEPSGDQEKDILTELENELYQVQGIKKVNTEFGSSPGKIEIEDMPHVQVSEDASDYDHRQLAFGGAHPVVQWRLTLRVTTSAAYEPQDVSALRKRIEQRLLRQNFTLNGTAVSVELRNGRPLPREEDSESEVRQFELALLITYIKEITQ